MSLFLEVLHDLALFLREALLGKRSAQVRPLSLPESNSSRVIAAMDTATPVVFPQTTVVESNDLLAGFSRGYVVRQDVKVFARPVWAFDTMIATLPLGKAVSLLGFEGRFVSVETDALRGWVLKDDVSNREGDVWPELVSGVIYDANHESTVRIRQVIDDAFFAADLFLPLQPQEYIMYLLLRQRRSLPEVSDRPRLVGKWHEIYKGKLGVTVGLEPKANSVMEGLTLSAEPFLGFVTSVHTDQSVVVESVGRHTEGEFLKETLSKSAWLDTQPVFIQF